MGINEFLKTILEWIYGFVGNYGWGGSRCWCV